MGIITVTKPFLPDKNLFFELQSEVFENRSLTNMGPLYSRLQLKLAERAGVYHRYVSNGTISLQLLLKQLGAKGEIITTPFSYIATTNAILWEGGTPVFADINPETCNSSPDLVEKCINSKTKGILLTHVYGIPCDVEALEQIASKHGIWLVFDAAHAFDVEYGGRSLFSYGTAASASYHATKIFHTVEGGGIYSSDFDLISAIGQWMNFGHTSPEEFDRPGINAKNSELHAAMGLAILPQMEHIISRRKEISDYYDAELPKGLTRPTPPEGTKYNYAYYPVFFQRRGEALQAKINLEKKGIGTRRYFYPSLNSLTYLPYHKACPVSEDIADRVLCLPLYPDLKETEQNYVIQEIKRFLNA